MVKAIYGSICNYTDHDPSIMLPIRVWKAIYIMLPVRVT